MFKIKRQKQKRHKQEKARWCGAVEGNVLKSFSCAAARRISGKNGRVPGTASEHSAQIFLMRVDELILSHVLRAGPDDDVIHEGVGTVPDRTE